MARDWLTRLKSIFAREHSNGVIVMINEARDECLRDVLLALSPPHEVKIFIGVEQLVEANDGDLAIFLPKRDDTTWLNINRPFFADKKLRIILWLSQEHAIHLQKNATDLFDWLSHHLECPKEEPPSEPSKEGQLELFLRDPPITSIVQRLPQKPTIEQSIVFVRFMLGDANQKEPQRIIRLVAMTRLLPNNLARLIALLSILGRPPLQTPLKSRRTTKQKTPAIQTNKSEGQTEPLSFEAIDLAVKEDPTLQNMYDRFSGQFARTSLELPRALNRQNTSTKIEKPPIDDKFPRIKKAGSFASFRKKLEEFTKSLGAAHPETIEMQRELEKVRNSLPELLSALQHPRFKRSNILMLLSFALKSTINFDEVYTTTDGETIFWSPEDLSRGERHFGDVLHHHLLHAVLLHPIYAEGKHAATWRRATEEIVGVTLERLPFVRLVGSLDEILGESAESLYISMTRVDSIEPEPSCLKLPSDPALIISSWREAKKFTEKFLRNKPFEEWTLLANKIAEGLEPQTNLPQELPARYALLHTLATVSTSSPKALHSFEWAINNASFGEVQFFGNQLSTTLRSLNLQGALALAVQKSPKLRGWLSDYQSALGLGGGTGPK